MEEEIDYIIKYKNDQIKIKKKYEIKIIPYLILITCLIVLVFGMFLIIFLINNIEGALITLFLMILYLLGIFEGHQCYLYFDKNILKIHNSIASYKIPIEDLLNISIEKNKYAKLIKIQYIKNKKVNTIKIIVKSYTYRATGPTFNEGELQNFLNIFKTKKECSKEKIGDEYLTINRNYSYEEIKQMLTDNEIQIDLPGGIWGALLISIIVLISAVLYLFKLLYL